MIRFTMSMTCPDRANYDEYANLQIVSSKTQQVLSGNGDTE